MPCLAWQAQEHSFIPIGVGVLNGLYYCTRCRTVIFGPP